MARTAVYIDGGPFTDAVRGQGLSMEMNLRGFVLDLADTPEIVSVDFVTAEYPAFPYPAKHRNQLARLDQISNQGINVHLCKPQLIGSVFIDRGVEALFTAKLIGDAHADLFDVALVVSHRQELSPALVAVRKLGKSVKLAYFEFITEPTNPLGEFADEVSIISPEAIVRHRQTTMAA